MNGGYRRERQNSLLFPSNRQNDYREMVRKTIHLSCLETGSLESLNGSLGNPTIFAVLGRIRDSAVLKNENSLLDWLRQGISSQRISTFWFIFIRCNSLEE